MLNKAQFKLFRITTIPLSLNILLRGQLRFLNEYFNVTGVSSSGSEVEEIKSREGIDIIEVSMEREISIFKDLKSLNALFKLFKKENPQIVHSNTPKASLLSMIAAKLAGVPIRIYTVTGLRFEGFEPSIKKNILVLMERITCTFATHVIPEGDGVKQTLIKNRITPKPLRIVGNGNINGVDTDYFSIRHFPLQQLNELKNNLGVQEHDFVFCFVGRLVIDKGIAELVNAFKRLTISNTKLLLIGPIEKSGNALSDAILNEIKQNPDIVTTGFVNDIRPFLAMSNVFVFPSYREGFPNVVLQAGAMELPCIVSNISGSNEIIEDHKNGLIVPVKNETALLLAMKKLIEDKNLLHILQDNSRKMITNRFEQSFVWSEMLKRYNEYLCEVKIENK